MTPKRQFSDTDKEQYELLRDKEKRIRVQVNSLRRLLSKVSRARKATYEVIQTRKNNQ